MKRMKTGTPPIRSARPEKDRIRGLVSRLRRVFSVDPADISVVRAPLRICPLGAHIDHQQGIVTGMTITPPILMAFAPTLDGTVHVQSAGFDQAIQFPVDRVPPCRNQDWGNYLRGAVLALRQDHRVERGLVGVVDGEMPIGGLSSSAAVTVAYLLALEAVHALHLSPETNVSLVRFTENKYIGLNNGILDQSVILFSRKDHLTRIDCGTVRVDRFPAAPQAKPFDILVVHSGVTRSLVGTDYNNRVAECQEAARLLLRRAGGPDTPDPRLDQLEPDVFRTHGGDLPAPLQGRAEHYFSEMERVESGMEAWRSGDLNRFGALMTASGESSIRNYECGSPPLITLYEILSEAPGVYGTRFSGAGFRGSCLALVDPEARQLVAETVHRRYPAAHPAQAGSYSIHFCGSDGSANVTPWEAD